MMDIYQKRYATEVGKRVMAALTRWDQEDPFSFAEAFCGEEDVPLEFDAIVKWVGGEAIPTALELSHFAHATFTNAHWLATGERNRFIAIDKEWDELGIPEWWTTKQILNYGLTSFFADGHNDASNKNCIEMWESELEWKTGCRARFRKTKGGETLHHFHNLCWSAQYQIIADYHEENEREVSQ